MADANSLGATVLQLRLNEEHCCRDDMRHAQHELEQTREQIRRLDEHADAYHYAAIVAQAEGKADAAQTLRRRQQDAMLQRAKLTGELAAAKARFGACRDSLLDAIQRRSQLDSDSIRTSTDTPALPA